MMEPFCSRIFFRSNRILLGLCSALMLRCRFVSRVLDQLLKVTGPYGDGLGSEIEEKV
ncbi:hypothetical protein Hanom_Chr09g00813171 [Helianthus anomalus]